MQEKLIHLDLETTGLDSDKSGITQIAGIIEIDGKEVEKFDFRVKPFPQKEISLEALKVTGVTAEQLNKSSVPQIVYREFTAMLKRHINQFDKKDKFHMVGYNCQSFDSAFLRVFFADNGDKYYGSFFWSATIDVMVLAANALRHKRHEMVNFKLGTVAEELGIELDESKLHDAMYDIELTKAIFEIVG
ncbi:3'-5' exonuclease [Candidatus Pacearchaeota archaeon]|nr:3'-5' exonuclease [Candidatus Pacearchaeota archaeon]